jgi:zona occludens toxin (predicted ATPase)
VPGLAAVDERGPAAGDERYLVTEFCGQADYARRIYPDAAKTIRILTLGTDDVSVAAAAHRFGSGRTGALDNFSQGGLSALVDLETGKLSVAAEPLPDGGVARHETHPDTGGRIAGVTVPGWAHIRDRIRTVAAGTAGMAHVGWDVVVTGPGESRIIEGNGFPDPDLIRVHRPLLADEDVRRFYRDHGVL